MNTKTTIVLMICVAIGGGALLIYQLKPPTTATPGSDTGTKDLFEPKPAEVNKVEMLAGNKRMAFEKTGDKWRITAPIQAPADKYQVDNIVTKITGLKATRSYGP